MDPSLARVLIIDDRRSNLLLLAEILAPAGFRNVLGSTDPTRAPALCEAFRPDIVLLDLYMPELDGFAVLRELRARESSEEFLPVLILTADPGAEVRQRALASGAQDFLAKPLDPVEVVLRIRNLLATRGLHRALREEKAQLEARVRERTRELEEAQGEILERLAQAAELRDDDTGLHTRRVGDIAASLATCLGCPAELVERIRHTAPLHDIGKIAVPDAVLRKPGPLDASERAQMQLHTLVGARILAGGRAESIRLAEQIALAHHERWDGSGYPRGLRGQEIPLEARIVAVADVYDALAHDRPYRRAWPTERALAEIRAGAGTLFDPRVVVALERCLEGGPSVA